MRAGLTDLCAVVRRRRKCRASCRARSSDYVGIRTSRLRRCGRLALQQSSAARSDALPADEFLSDLRTLVEEKLANWRLHAASTVLVLGEVIFGASPAWSEITGWRHVASEAWTMTDAGMHCAALAATAAAALDEITAPVTLAATEGSHGPMTADDFAD